MRGLAPLLTVLLLSIAPIACTRIDASDPLPVQPEVKTDPAGRGERETKEDSDDDDDGDEGEPSGKDAEADEPADPPADAGVVNKPLLESGLHPDASDAFRAIGVSASSIEFTLVNGSTHQKDGDANGRAYSAATDLKTTGMTADEIKALLGKLGAAGFAAWYRKPGTDNWPARGTTHIHAVWAGCPMKATLREQMRDWLEGKNGTSNHAQYQYFSWPESSKEVVRASFVKFNPATE